MCVTAVVGGALGLGGSIYGAKQQSKAARGAADAQTYQAQLAIEEQRAAREEARELLQPFVDVGTGTLDRLSGLAGQGVTIPGELTPLSDISQPGLAETYRGLSPEIYQASEAERLRQEALQTGGGQQLLGEVSGLTGELDPSVLSSPEFEAQQQEAARTILDRAAAGGRSQAGETQRALAKESLLLGRQFAQQDLQNRLTAQNQRFGQLQSALGFGTGEQAQRFQQLATAGGFGQSEQAQRFQQLLAQSGALTAAEQQELQNQLAIQGQQFSQQDIANQRLLENQLAARGTRFSELMNLAQLGQASAAGSAAGATQSSAAIGNLLTDIGAAQAAGQVGAAGAKSGAISDIFGLAGTLGGAYLGRVS